MSTLATVRTAYRYVVAYERRVLDGIAGIHEALFEFQYEFVSWGPLRTAFPKPKQFPGDKWAWDYTPLYTARFAWCRGRATENRAGNAWFFLDHVADTAREHVTVKGEPDPLSSLSPAEETRSVLRARWVKLDSPLAEALWKLEWDGLIARHFDSALPGVWPTEATPHPVVRSQDGVTAGGHVIELDQVERPEHLRERFIEPIVEQLRKLL